MKEDLLTNDSLPVDSVQLAKAVNHFNEAKALRADGKIGEGTIRMLNTSDRDKIRSHGNYIDRYKMLPDSMPSRYIWVNLPGYYMQLIEDDSVAAGFKNCLWQRDYANTIAHQCYFQYGYLSTMDHT